MHLTAKPAIFVKSTAPLMVLSVVFLVVYSWEILSRTHIALCETVINVIWVVFVVDYVVSLSAITYEVTSTVLKPRFQLE